MGLQILPFCKLPDTPFTEHQGLYNYLLQLNRIMKHMSGLAGENNRVLTYGDLTSSRVELLNKLTPIPGWDDLRFPASTIKLGPTNPPGWVKLTGLGEIYALGFDKTTDEEVHFVVQMPHAWQEGSNLRPHIHWTSDTGNSGTVCWKLEYTKAKPHGTFASTQTLTMTPDNPDQWEHALNAFGEIDMEGDTLSTILICRLWRDTSEDTLNEDALLLEIDFHYRKDAFGSLFEFIKR